MWTRTGSAPRARGDETAGGSVSTPDEDVVDVFARALGVERASDAPVTTSQEILGERDRQRARSNRPRSAPKTPSAPAMRPRTRTKNKPRPSLGPMVALITGGSLGLGLILAHEFGRHGARGHLRPRLGGAPAGQRRSRSPRQNGCHRPLRRQRPQASRNHGGSCRARALSVEGMLFVNRAGWAHCFDAVASVTGSERGPLRSGRVKAAAPVRTWGVPCLKGCLASDQLPDVPVWQSPCT
jgi:Family of unknown function (DUF6335)